MANYDAINSTSPSPYGSGDPYYRSSTGFVAPQSPKKSLSRWIKLGVPVGILVVAGAVVGAVLATHHNHSSSSSSGPKSSSGNPAAASSAISAKNAIGIFPTATNTEFTVPVYPSTTNAAFQTGAFNPAATGLAWPSDTFTPSNPAPTSLRPDRPRLIAPKYKWDGLSARISQDAYLKSWNDTIYQNAAAYYSLSPVVYHMDGSSGILDNAREIKMRIKAFAYVARLTQDTKWVDRAWAEILNAAGNGTQPFGNSTDRWNNGHFLDSAELCAAYAIAYDWLYDSWNGTQLDAMRFTMNEYCLGPGLTVFQGDPNGIGWWATEGIRGNWNCVCNDGLTLGALAILGDDTTGNAAALLGYTINNANQNCGFIASSDGTHNETANYMYFAVTGHAEMASSLMTAAGSSFGLLTTNPSLNLIGEYFMYVHGATTMFEYGDHGPNKFSTTGNAMLFYGSQYNTPQYTLFQRDRADAAEPWSMFWYDSSVTGAFWDGLPLDYAFNNTGDQWVSMRSSWTDINAVYVAIKGGQLLGHQTHGDLDCGDFVLDALGTRWFGELGSGDYLSTGYFSSEAQDSQRWLYYRKRTEGQNTILINQQNQLVTATPPVVTYGSSGTTQGPSTVFNVPSDSTAFAVFDLTTAYGNATSVKRGIRLVNGRQEVLLQDEITTTGSIMWRAHTNATITVSGSTATLSRDNQTLIATILNPPSGVQFTTADAVRLAGDPALPTGQTDQPNPGVTVLVIDIPTVTSGNTVIEILFTPGGSQSSSLTAKSVPLSQWSLTSHD
ncbi:chondroitin AC/alginate lyase [Russula dissimulans]|nr:chondroitin AC/alginate lyase [Russula dissimulans]